MNRQMRWLIGGLVLSTALLNGPAAAQACSATPGDPADRAVVADLGRIVDPAGVQEAFALRVGGIDQWVTVRGQDRANPVILFLHGGPASPLTPTLWQFQRPLEEYFTMVTYDQRGAGKTFRATDPAKVADTLQLQRYVDDAIAVALDIRHRYHKDKLVLMGHSWGTAVGMQAALARPDLFSAYVGIGQVIDMRANERISYDYAVQQATERHDAPALAELATIAPYPGDQPITRERIVIARKWAQAYGGLSAFRADSPYFFNAARLSPEYDRDDACAIDAGNQFTLGRVLPEFLAVNFSAVRDFPIPVVMLMGRHDYTTPSAPTAAWLDRVHAPYKRGIWFEHSAHMLPWEEPGKLLVSLLDTVRPMALDRKQAGRRQRRASGVAQVP